VKTLTSILAAGAILAFAAQAGTAANVKHAKHSTARVGYGPYAYLGDTAQAKQGTTRVGFGPYAYLGDTAQARQGTTSLGFGPYAYLGDTAPVG
jgi:hypothetical protein